MNVSQHADDFAVSVQGHDSVAHLLSLLHKFNNLSGLKINTTKSKGICLSRCKDKALAFVGPGAK